MQVISGLLGAVIGGILVLLGDMVRRRAEDRRAEVRRLAEAAADLAALYGRIIGQIRDMKDGAAPLTQSAFRAERYEMESRFFMTPGADELRPSIDELLTAYQELVRLPGNMILSENAYQRYVNAQRVFAATMQQIIRRGRISRRLDLGWDRAVLQSRR